MSEVIKDVTAIPVKPKRRNKKKLGKVKNVDKLTASVETAAAPLNAPVDGAIDELVEYSKSQSIVNDTAVSPRYVNIILDHSAFIRGIGNIKRWFNEEYIHQNLSPNRSIKTVLNFYIPTYTLHEFDFSKKGNSMTATNAREAVRFIDQLFENENNRFNINSSKSEEEYILFNIYIESPSEAGPSWNDCTKYQVHSPKVKEFPNFKTKFDSNLIGYNFNSENYLDDSKTKLNDIQYENSESFQLALANSDNLAEMPTRLRYLIRACIHKQFIESKRNGAPTDWKLITENPITKIWANSFGIDCLNVNESEVLIFQNHDVNQFKMFNPHNAYNIGDDDYSHESNILQNTIDTTQYSYESVNKPRKQNKVKGHKMDGVVEVDSVGINGDVVKRERYDSINYAPRLKGSLWKP